MESQPIHRGSRGADFREVVLSFLRRGGLTQEHIDRLSDDSAMRIWGMVFTARCAHPTENYELYETLGDGVANNALVYYLVRRFPEINCPDGVPVLARLKINLVSKDTFRTLNEQHLGFWPYITAAEETRQKHQKTLLEDTFEAAMGALVWMVDDRIYHGAGFAIAYNIIESLFNLMTISLSYDDLFDAKTRLKEMVDAFKLRGPVFNGRRLPPIGDIEYRRADRQPHGGQHGVSVYRIESRTPRSESLLSSAQGTCQKDAEQKAADIAVKKLRTMGYVNPPKEAYARFCRY